MVDLLRIGKSEVNTNADGIDFSGPMLESLNLVGLFSRELAFDTESSSYQQVWVWVWVWLCIQSVRPCGNIQQ